METDLAQSQAAGFAAHLTKPINFGELEALLLELAKVYEGEPAN